MTPDELAAIRARADAATPGPWVDLTTMYFERMAEWHKKTRRWWHGTRAWCLPVALICRATVRGEPITREDIPERVDWFDLTKVIGLRWGAFPKKTTMLTEGFLGPKDAAFIAAARSDIPRLLDALAEAEAKVVAVEQLAAACEHVIAAVFPTDRQSWTVQEAEVDRALAAWREATG